VYTWCAYAHLHHFKLKIGTVYLKINRWRVKRL
jgi:hypothetical protein